jgi:hypothetical protein
LYVYGSSSVVWGVEKIPIVLRSGPIVLAKIPARIVVWLCKGRAQMARKTLCKGYNREAKKMHGK